MFDLQHHDREKTNTVSVFRWFHPSKASKLFQHMETDSRMVLSGLKKGGSWALMLSEDGVSAVPDGKVPKAGQTQCGHTD